MHILLHHVTPVYSAEVLISGFAATVHIFRFGWTTHFMRSTNLSDLER